MARKFNHIPPSMGADPTVQALAEAVRYITAQTQTELTTLSTTATTAEIITKINQIIARLQGN